MLSVMAVSAHCFEIAHIITSVPSSLTLNRIHVMHLTSKSTAAFTLIRMIL